MNRTKILNDEYKSLHFIEFKTTVGCGLHFTHAIGEAVALSVKERINVRLEFNGAEYLIDYEKIISLFPFKDSK